MSFKTILVYCDSSEATKGRLAVAIELSQRFGSHLIALHVRPSFETAAFFDSGLSMDTLYTAYREGMEREAAAAKAIFDAATERKDLPAEWRSVEGFVDDEVVVHARYADLVVAGQAGPPERANVSTPSDLSETVAMASGRMVLVVPYIPVAEAPGKIVMLCWNASRESARAATDALPFLKGAEKVIVLVVDPGKSRGHGAEPGADVAGWLVRHGVKAFVQRDTAVDGDVGATILSRAADHGVDLIVMGIYGHSRVREFVLGGASRTLLASMTVPVLMAH